MRLVLLGAPGSGKGTQAQRMQARHGVPQVSTGDLLREAVAAGTPLGRAAKTVMDAGQLVADDIMLGIIRERLAKPDAARGFILDGFPRTIAQADGLADQLADLGLSLDAVVLLDVDPEVLLRRMAGRRSCRRCGRVFHLESNEQTVRERLAVYAERTRPLIEYYAKKGMLKRVDADGTLDAVDARIERVLQRR
jgi:adenylate kinase